MAAGGSEQFMQRAVILARRGIGKTAPNPAVGCVIVKDGIIIGEGWHRKAGTPHAEIHALTAAGMSAKGGDVYVTLEPCSHFGKTPPCAEALVAAGVRRVVAGMVDPNPLVAGRGLNILRNAGIQVECGILEQACRKLNEPFIKFMSTGRPFVILKSAMTLDGKTATASGDSKWISNEKSRIYVHKLRSIVDAVMVGIGTVVADNPSLNTRLPGGKDPVRVIVDSSLRIPLNAQVLHLSSTARTLIATITDDPLRIANLQDIGVEVVLCREKDGRVDLNDLMLQLGLRGMQSVLLEGGGELAASALRMGLIDKFLLFYAPKMLGGEGTGLFAGSGAISMAESYNLKDITLRRFADDILVQGYPEKTCLPA